MNATLHIGQVARLLGISAKTIRHYHRVGLLAEPPRSEGNYRLYSARDVLRLQRIRRLQSLGLSLAEIGNILGNVEQERSLWTVLRGLLEQVSNEISALEARRDRILRLLEEESLDRLEYGNELPPSLRALQARYGPTLAQEYPALWEQDRKLFAVLEELHLPTGQHETMQEVASYMVAHPEIYERGLELGERLMALEDVPVDAPEVETLVQAYLDFLSDHPFLVEVASRAAPLEEKLSALLSDIMTETFDPSPAQRRFLEIITRSLET